MEVSASLLCVVSRITDERAFSQHIDLVGASIHTRSIEAVVRVNGLQAGDSRTNCYFPFETDAIIPLTHSLWSMYLSIIGCVSRDDIENRVQMLSFRSRLSSTCRREIYTPMDSIHGIERS
jgi:hypothetical protein